MAILAESNLPFVDESTRGLAMTGGPHEGTYSISLNHMRVKRPRNISDEELETMSESFDRPLSEPTIMAYNLQRIRLGEICREMADLTWSKDTDEVSVDDIQRIDASFDNFFAELPMFLRIDSDSKIERAQMDIQRPYLRLQRYIINLTAHAKRCKFHLPFLLRASVDSNYTFSRMACLHSARSLIQLREELMQESASLWIANTRLCGILHIFFYATVVLVMDLCVNRGSMCETARKVEIQQACRTLEEAKQQSAAAGMFLDSLLAILRKHRIKLQNTELGIDTAGSMVSLP
jgi:hypothetical protein